MCLQSICNKEQLCCDTGRHRIHTGHGTKKKALGNFDTGCVNSTVCLEILHLLMYLLAETSLS